MGLRSRLKESLKSALGRGTTPTGATAPAGAMPTTAATPSTGVSPSAASRPATPPLAAASRPAPASAAPEAPASAPPGKAAADPEQQEKIEKHRRKTKAGMLKWLSEQEGGAAHMGVMHDHCEKRFFVAHRAFSNLMEDLTEGGLVTYDAESGMVTVTAAGRAWRG
ncbi:hypothetical protein L6R53_09460 [Myxococcota bacterium]|nr:hypothetical protein [Myxococcota bacterium]